MKNTRLTSILGSNLIACALTLGSLASTQFASAQSAIPLAEANIPFAFQTGSQTLPAGTYRINRQSNHLLLLRGPGKASEFVQTYDAIRNHAADHGTIVFDRVGDKYFLRQIWTAGSKDGLECPKSRAEKESLMAKTAQAPSSTVLALNVLPQH